MKWFAKKKLNRNCRLKLRIDFLATHHFGPLRLCPTGPDLRTYKIPQVTLGQIIYNLNVYKNMSTLFMKGHIAKIAFAIRASICR
jgi:hypothetical protein